MTIEKMTIIEVNLSVLKLGSGPVLNIKKVYADYSATLTKILASMPVKMEDLENGNKLTYILSSTKCIEIKFVSAQGEINSLLAGFTFLETS